MHEREVAQQLQALPESERPKITPPSQPKPNGAQAQAPYWPEFLTAKDILQLPPDPTRWIWDRTLPAGGCSILVSKPKVGKSTMAINLCLAISRGNPFLGRDTQRVPIAYLSLDATLPETAEIFARFGLQDSDPVFIHAGAAPRDSIKWLVQRVKQYGVRFIVIDTLQRLFRFQDLNAYSEVTNRMESLLESARRQKCHVLFLHHAKKGDGDDLDASIGSTAIRGLAYSYLFLKRLPNSDRRILRSDQRGGQNFEELAISFSDQGWLEIAGTMEQAEIDEAKPKVIEFVESEDGDVSEKDIRNALPIRTIVVSKAIRELTKSGQLERTGEGRKGKPFRYSLGSSTSLERDSVPREGVIGEGIPGTESKNQSQVIENTTKDSVPKKSGTEREQNGTEFFSGSLGTESGNSKKGVGSDDVLRLFPGTQIRGGK